MKFEGKVGIMETLLRRSGWLTVGAVLMASLAWAQSRGTSEDESAIKALVESQNRVLVQGVGNPGGRVRGGYRLDESLGYTPALPRKAFAVLGAPTSRPEFPCWQGHT